jgi:hypothetical protein
MNISKVMVVALALVAIVVGVSIFKGCVKPVVPGGNSNPVVVVTPTAVTPAVQHMLPAGQTAHTQIVVSHVNTVPGMVPTQHIIVSDQGNTFCVTTNSIDWGFKFEPSLVVGFDSKAFGGLGLNFFRVWKFDTDALLTISGKDIDNDIRVGVGESYQLFNNTFIGVAFQIDANVDKHLGVYLNLHF